MSESGPEVKGPKGGISDRLISLNVRLTQTRPVHGHFIERPDPEDPGRTIKEKELPVFQEAIDLQNEVRETDRTVTRAENPFGKINKFKLDVFGDVHITGSYPEESVESRSPFPRMLQEAGPRSRDVTKRSKVIPAGLTSKYKSFEEYRNSGDYIEPVTEVNGYVGTGTNWADQVKPAMSVQGFRLIGETIVEDVTAGGEFLDPDSATVVVDMGDTANTESLWGDIAQNTIEWENIRRRAEAAANTAMQKPTNELTLQQFQREKANHILQLKKEKGLSDDAVTETYHPNVRKVRVLGNHDSDLNNKGLDEEEINQKLFGNQEFLQFVGEDYAVLAINTNLQSSFWWKNYRKLKSNASTDEEKATIAGMEEEIKLQQGLIKKAKDSGRKLIVLAHESELAVQAIGIADSRVTHIICGHLHEAKNEPMKARNADGDQVQLVRVGAAFVGMPGWDKVQDPVGYSVTINKGKDGHEMVEVKTLQISEKTKREQEIIREAS